MTEKQCAWCRGPIPAGARRDSICCSTRCRQARHRFVSGVGPGPVAERSTTPLRLAYADPPYPGLSRRYYSEHRDYAGEVDHAELIRHLSTFDGWALSTNERSLQYVLGLCPPGVRIASWHRGERPTRSGGPLNAWEPVIYFGGRIDPSLTPAYATRSPGTRDASVVENHATDPRPPRRGVVVAPRRQGKTAFMEMLAAAERDGSLPLPTGSPQGDVIVLEEGMSLHRGHARRVDTLEHFSRPRLTDPHRVVGAKPAVFCRWVFDLLGALPVDDFTDVFPGSGGVSLAWRIFAGHPH